MIKTIPSLNTAHFGHGTICVHPELRKDIGIIDLKTCAPMTIGAEIPPGSQRVKKKPIIRLQFTKTESIDVLILKLQCVKELMLEEIENVKKEEGTAEA